VAKNLPHNVKLYGVSGLPESTMRLLIQGCSLSPMITGDVSFSIALGAISPSKGLMLETPSRAKLNSAQALTKQAAARAVELGLAESLEQAEEKFQTALMLSGVWSIARIAENLGARDVWQEFYVCVTQLSDGWQIMKNLANYYHFFGLFQHEFNNSILVSPKSGDFGILEHQQLLEFLLRELNQTANWNSFPERLMKTIQDESASLLERVYCLIALLKLPSVSPAFFGLIHGDVWREAQRQLRLVAQLVRSTLEQEHFHSKLKLSLNGSPDGAQFVGALEDYLTSAGCAESLLIRAWQEEKAPTVGS